MKRKHFEKNSAEWLEWRKGKITGSRLHDIIVKRGNSRKIGFYEVMAERLVVEHENDDDNPLDRGHNLEQQAIDLFEEMTGHEVNTDCGVWISDENDFISISPDGEISETHAVEVKCLGSAKHLQAYFEKEIPCEYEAQAIQYFIVNEKLEQLFFVFYDPRIPCLPLHYLTIDRENVEKTIEAYKEYEAEVLKDIEEKINQLTF